MYHNGYDGGGSGVIVANENGSLSLTYDNVHGIRTGFHGAFDFYQTSHGSTNTIKNYFAQFGSSETSMLYLKGNIYEKEFTVYIFAFGFTFT